MDDYLGLLSIVQQHQTSLTLLGTSVHRIFLNECTLPVNWVIVIVTPVCVSIIAGYMPKKYLRYEIQVPNSRLDRYLYTGISCSTRQSSMQRKIIGNKVKSRNYYSKQFMCLPDVKQIRIQTEFRVPTRNSYETIAPFSHIR